MSTAKWGWTGRMWRVRPAWVCLPDHPCSPTCKGLGNHGRHDERWDLSVYAKKDGMDTWVTLDVDTRKPTAGAQPPMIPPDAGALCYYATSPKLEDEDDMWEALRGRCVKYESVWFTTKTVYGWGTTGLYAGEMVKASGLGPLRNIYTPDSPEMEPLWLLLEAESAKWEPKDKYSRAEKSFRTVTSQVHDIADYLFDRPKVV